MDITHAYIREHGECPEWDSIEIDYWRCNKVYFTSGWYACLANTEILEIEADVLYQQEGLLEGR